MTKGLIPPSARLKAKGLLDMLYKPSELAAELDIDRQLVYKQLIPAGLPHARDPHGHVWINGLEAYRWLVQNGKRSPTLKEDEAFCLRCRQAVPMVQPTRSSYGSLHLLKAICPRCGCIINRGVKA